MTSLFLGSIFHEIDDWIQLSWSDIMNLTIFQQKKSIIVQKLRFIHYLSSYWGRFVLVEISKKYVGLQHLENRQKEIL